MKKSFVVRAENHGMRLLQFLREALSPQYSVKALKRAIEQKRCQINGKTETFSTVFLQRGDRIEITLDDSPKKTDEKIAILYEDATIAICNKPVGVVSDESCIQKILGVPWLLVHRLDKETSGVLILAKTKEAKEKMVSLFEKMEIHKLYIAVLKGKIRANRGLIETFFKAKGAYSGQTLWGSAKSGLKAITLWRCIKRGSDFSVVLCKPITGKTHQLRVHFAELGHPIIGDTQYGREIKSSHQPNRHLLHALAIRFTHPMKGKRIKVSAPIPSMFKPFLGDASYSASLRKEAK